MQHASEPLVGTVINGKYHIHRAIARGGMGQIYYATQAPLDRPVALKVVESDGAKEDDSQFLKRFLQEASILAKLQHPNVVTLFDYGQVESSSVERYFIAMEFLNGETLAKRLTDRGTLPGGEALVLFRQIARGLREAHARGVVHRDLKPSNIILVPEGDGAEIVKIVDFGIGKVLATQDEGQDLTREGMMVGTPRYMAPEQFEAAAYPATDIYSLGTIIYQALAGNLPFTGKTVAEMMVAKFAQQAPRIRDVNPRAELTDGLEALIFQCLARKPTDRPTMEALFAQLAAVEDEVFGVSGARSIPGRSGAYPFPPRSVPQPATAPHSSGSMPPSAALSGTTGPIFRVPEPAVSSPQNVTHLLQMTPRPMARSAAPPPSSPSRAWGSTAIVVVAILGLTALAGGAAWRAHTRNAVAAEAGDTPPEPEGVPATEETAQIPTGAFELLLDSSPSGAIVLEGEREIGVTPVRLSIPKASVEKAPRTFVLRKEGFAPATLSQGLSDRPVRSVVPLATDPEGPVKSPHKTPGGRPSGASNPGNTQSGAKSNGDIRLSR